MRRPQTMAGPQRDGIVFSHCRFMEVKVILPLVQIRKEESRSQQKKKLKKFSSMRQKHDLLHGNLQLLQLFIYSKIYFDLYA